MPPGRKAFRAKDEIRTRDPDLGKVVLYQLSYSRSLFNNLKQKPYAFVFCECKCIAVFQNSKSTTLKNFASTPFLPLQNWYSGIYLKLFEIRIFIKSLEFFAPSFFNIFLRWVKTVFFDTNSYAWL